MAAIKLETLKVKKAVEALREIGEKLQKENKLLDEVDSVEMQVCLKKIPFTQKTIKLRLPYSAVNDEAEVCLFVKDLDREDRDYDSTIRHFQDLFRTKGISSIPDIIPLKSVKTEYKPYESKRNLSQAYDVYLADDRIIRLLPSYLGKSFYGRKRAPVQVNLLAKDLAKEISSAISNSRCIISTRGCTNTAVIGTIKLSDAQLSENVVASATQISECVPGGAENVKTMNIKLKNSASIPVYYSKGGPQDVVLPKKEKPEDVEAEEISTVFGAKVKVYPDGRVKLVKEDGTEFGEKKKKGSRAVVKKGGKAKFGAKRNGVMKKNASQKATQKQPVAKRAKRPLAKSAKRPVTKSAKGPVTKSTKQPTTITTKSTKRPAAKSTKRPAAESAKTNKAKRAKTK